MEGYVRIANVSRSDGRTAVACAAYRAGDDLHSEYTGLEYDYSHKGSVESARIFLPNGAPEVLADREVLWNTIESLEKRKDAVQAKEILCAIPQGLSADQRKELVEEYCHFLSAMGIICDACIHNPPQHDDLGRPINEDGLPEKDPAKYIYNNPHVHILVAARTVDENGKFLPKTEGVYICKNVTTGEQKDMSQAELIAAGAQWKKLYRFRKSDGSTIWTTRDKAAELGYEKTDPYPLKRRYGRPTGSDYLTSEEFVWDCREVWGRVATEALHKAGIDEVVEMRSYKAQGSAKVGQKHKGPTAEQMDRKADRFKAEGRDPRTIVYSAMRNINVEIRKHNHMVDVYEAREKEAEEIKTEAERCSKLLTTYRSEWISAKAHRMQFMRQYTDLTSGTEDLREKVQQFEKMEKTIIRKIERIDKKISGYEANQPRARPGKKVTSASLTEDRDAMQQMLLSIRTDYGYSDPNDLKKDTDALAAADEKIKEIEEELPKAATAESEAKEKYLSFRQRIPVKVKKYITENVVHKPPEPSSTVSALDVLTELAAEIVIREIEEVEYEDKEKKQ